MDLSIFDSLMAMHDELEAHMLDLVAPSTVTEQAVRRQGLFRPEPKLDVALLRRVEKEHRNVLAALQQAKPTTEPMIMEFLRVAAAPFRPIDAGNPKPQPKAATPIIVPGQRAAKPKPKAKAKKGKKQ